MKVYKDPKVATIFDNHEILAIKKVLNSGDCPKAENSWFNEQLSLSLAPNMTEKEINYIENAVKKKLHFFARNKI